MRTANRLMYQMSLTDQACLPIEMVQLATAISRARTPTYTRSLETSPGSGQVDDSIIQDEINLWVVCGSTGVLEFALIRDGDSGYQGALGTPLTILNVIAGQKVEGHFLRIGAQTNCFPLIGFGNLP